MAWESIQDHEYNPECEFLKAGNCYWCCPRCNYQAHTCGGCGQDLDHNGMETDKIGQKQKHGICYE